MMKLYLDIDGVFLDYESGVVAESGENLWNIFDYITLNVPPRAFSNVPLQIWSL